jgi:hypothetical protein
MGWSCKTDATDEIVDKNATVTSRTDLRQTAYEGVTWTECLDLYIATFGRNILPPFSDLKFLRLTFTFVSLMNT